MPIPSTDKRLMEICGGQRNASNLIKFMCKIGLLELYDGHFQFNATKKNFNQSKKYRYFYDNEVGIIEYCRDNGIKKRKKEEITNNTVVEKFSIDEKSVRFCSKLKLRKPDDLSKKQFEEYLRGALYRNYPELEHYQQIADHINTAYYSEEPNMRIRFEPKITWNKKQNIVRKIGIRATNAYVSAKKTNDNDEHFMGYYKDEILRWYGLNLEKDVKSSVPRITRSLNTGKWVNENIDIYEMIYHEYVKRRGDTGATIHEFSEVRSAIKSLHMRAYFDDAKVLGRNTRNAMARVLDKDEVDQEIQLLREAVVAAEGGCLFDSEVFYHESCIYMDVLEELLENGFIVWQCYDAWYAAKEGVAQEEFEAYVTRVVAEKANEYIARRNAIHTQAD